MFHNARMPSGQLKGIAHYGNRTWPAWIDESRDDVMVPIVRSASDVVVLVAGGDGRPLLLDGRVGRYPGIDRAGRVLPPAVAPSPSLLFGGIHVYRETDRDRPD